jgi:hypothetical protein
MFTKDVLHELLSRPDDDDLWIQIGQISGFSSPSALAQMRAWILTAVGECGIENTEHQILRDLYFADARRKDLQRVYDVAHRTLYRRRDRSLQALADRLNSTHPQTAIVPNFTVPMIRRPALEDRIAELLLDDELYG